MPEGVFGPPEERGPEWPDSPRPLCRTIGNPSAMDATRSAKGRLTIFRACRNPISILVIDQPSSAHPTVTVDWSARCSFAIGRTPLYRLYKIESREREEHSYSIHSDDFCGSLLNCSRLEAKSGRMLFGGWRIGSFRNSDRLRDDPRFQSTDFLPRK